MRRFLTVCVLLAAIGAAEPAIANAQNPCTCTQAWASSWYHSTKAQAAYRYAFAASAVPLSAETMKRKRAQVRTRVYDWATAGDFNPDGFCNRHKRVCKAAVVCVISGASASYATLANGGNYGQAMTNGGAACGSAAATTILYG